MEDEKSNNPKFTCLIRPEKLQMEEPLNKLDSFCVFCDKTDLLIKYCNKYICKRCINDIILNNDFFIWN